MFPNRRLTILVPLTLLPFFALLPSCGSGREVEDPGEMKVLVLGMDGLDPILLEQLMAEDRLPNFSRLAALGDYSPFGTSMPPQSPVAWSNFISGSRPGTHQIYDFIHRKPQSAGSWPVQPYLSTSEAFGPEDPDKAWTFGKWRIPLDSGGIENLRRGDAFWNHLVRAGIDTTIYRMPATYPPPEEVEGRGTFQCLTGMGTPDLLGSYGEFTCFRENMSVGDEKVAGGRFVRLDVRDHRAVAEIEGPENYLLDVPKGEEPTKMTVLLEIVRDPVEGVVTIAVGEEKLLLQEGEWTDWVPIEFKTGLPGSSVAGAMGLPTSMHAIIRLYVKEVHPALDIYVSPLNIDPANPANPISYPPEFAAEVAATTGGGGMYTTGIPEDTKALRSKPKAKTRDGEKARTAFNEDDFLQMVRLLVEERTKQHHYALADFKRGFLYFYFGHTDQLAHIFWRDLDPLHPGRREDQQGKYRDVVFDTYEEMDDRLGEAFEVMDDNDVLIVMSDHGFCSFRRGFNVNNWLIDNGYMTVRGMDKRSRDRALRNIKFDQTEVYALGLNGLYINLEGREELGIVPPERQRRLMEEVASKLEQVRDEDGSKVIEKVYFTLDEYPNADPQIAPDMLIGYMRNYRASWATALGGMARKGRLFEDNKDRWSGDHCIAYNLVPGIVVSNLKLTVDDPELSDLGPSILKLFGIETPETMLGRNIFGEKIPLRGG
ncbi:MAG: alkaline phosphatase family protein [Phycisphaerae bacterium]